MLHVSGRRIGIVRRRTFLERLFVIVVSLTASAASQHQLSNLDRGRALDILKGVSNDVKKHYYDPKMHGVDFDAKVAEAKAKIEKATSFNMAMSHIAAVLDTLDDSHTFFLPPIHSYRLDYGIQYQIIGNRCFLTHVRPKSDADAKGLKPGDEILTFNTYDINRDDIRRIQYVFSTLRPQSSLQLQLRDPTGAERSVEVQAKIVEGKQLRDLTGANGAVDVYDLYRQAQTYEHLTRIRYVDYGDALIVIKLPEFKYLVGSEVDSIVGKATKHEAVILDLRGNPGGAVQTLQFLAGGFFDKEVKIADRVGRKENKPQMSKSRPHPYSGKLVVLVDAESASAAELFARLVQLEKRGVVMGDKTMGAVMEAVHYEGQSGTDTSIDYGTSITDADLIMTDGKSLEHVGVTPDELLLPGAQALASGLDPVLAHAAESLGVKLTPEDAGKAFPYEWAPI
jgi:C-terminal processing protease CtpA/Prc